MKLGFGSDNHSPAHPKILAAIQNVNDGHCASYEQDQYSQIAADKFREIFGSNISVHYVFSGTAANVLSIKTFTESYHSVICTDCSHLNVDECGAPEFIAGVKLVAVNSKDGKFDFEKIKEKLIRKGDQHFSQPRMLSITQPTELGTVYTLEEMRKIRDLCHENNLLIHVDGARFFSAVAHLKVTAKEVCEAMGVDVLSLSGSKNGLLFGEVVVIFNRKEAKDFKFVRKQCMQLPSKTRFFAAQFSAYFENDLHMSMAGHQIEMAHVLAQKISSLVEITRPIETNVVFAIIPKSWFKALREESFFYVWNPLTWECRLMTSFDTTCKQIDMFAEKIRELKAAAPSS